MKKWPWMLISITAAVLWIGLLVGIWVICRNWNMLTAIATWVLAGGIGAAIWQIREVSKGQAGSAYQNIINASYELEKMYVKYPHLYLKMQRKKADIENDIKKRELTNEDKTRLDWITFMTLDFFDNLLYQKNGGLIKPNSEVWNTWERSMRNEFRRCPYLCEMLRDTSELYTKELAGLAGISQNTVYVESEPELRE